MTELVLIGIGMDQKQITDSLESCLLTDDEMDQDWSIFYDPLPAFHILKLKHYRRNYIMRVKITLACTETGDRNYITTKNKRNKSRSN